MKVATPAASTGVGTPKLCLLTYRARIVPQLSPAENQKQHREKKARRENEFIVDAVHHISVPLPIVQSVRS